MLRQAVHQVGQFFAGKPAAQVPETMLVRQAQTFGDGSVRTDFLQAQVNPTPKIFKADGVTPVPSHSYLPPTYMMPGGAEPHTDAHMHDTNYVGAGLLMKEKLAMMDTLGIRNSTSMPIPTAVLTLNEIGAAPEQFINLPAVLDKLNNKQACQAADHNHHCGPMEFYYVPASITKEVEDRKEGTLEAGEKGISLKDLVRDPTLIDRIVAQCELYLQSSVNSHLAAAIKNSGLTEAERSRIDPMITGLHLGDPRAAHMFLTELFHNKGVFTGIGEITLNKELVDEMFAGHRGQASGRTDPNAGFNMKKRLDPLINLMEMAGVVGAPVVLHCDVDDLHSQIADARRAANDGASGQTSASASQAPREPSNLAGITEMLTDPRLKDTTVVWAHAGGLGRFIQEGPGHIDKLEELLQRCPNLKLDISWSEVAKQLTKPEKLGHWADFIEKHSHRICFGSDTLAPKDTGTWNQTKALYEGLFSRISEVAKQNVLNHTYENTFVAARAKVRYFEEHVLTPEFHAQHLNQNEPISAETARTALRGARGIEQPLTADEVEARTGLLPAKPQGLASVQAQTEAIPATDDAQGVRLQRP